MVEFLVLEERHIKLISHKRMANVLGQSTMPLDSWQIPCSTAFICNRIFLTNTQ